MPDTKINLKMQKEAYRKVLAEKRKELETSISNLSRKILERRFR